MKKIITSWTTIILMAVLCVGIAACGGSDDDENNTTEIIDNNGDSRDSGASPTKDVLSPGIYFCIDATDIHQQCSDAEELGNYRGITNIINEYGRSGWDNSAWKVAKGDMIGVMSVYASLQYPTGSGVLVVSKQTYHTTTVYYYVDENEDCQMMPWSQFKGTNTTYSNGQFTYSGYNGNETVYYKRVK